MLIRRAIEDLRIRRLWIGQLGSSVGDELYRMAFVWLAAGILGADTGYATAIQMAVVVFFGVFLGGYGEAIRPDRMMIGVDLLRAFLSLLPAVLFSLGRVSYEVLLGSTVLMGALGTCFEPALQGSLPILAGQPNLLRAANGLMSTTYRLARVLGPGLIALLSAWVPVQHFFSLNALSYLLSAVSLWSLRGFFRPVSGFESSGRDLRPGSHLKTSLRRMLSHRDLGLAFVFKAVCGGIWGSVYLVGFALLARRLDPEGMGVYGWMTASYGIGNICSALLLASRERRHPPAWIYAGYFLVGASFMGMAQADSVAEICLFSALGALGGPLSDLPFVEMLQERFAPAQLGGLVRLRMVSENLFYLIFMLISPALLNRFGLGPSVAGAGFVCLLLSIGFYSRSRRAGG